jgi:hypothetical protein
MQKLDHNAGFQDKRQFFTRKLDKIAENIDHTVCPRRKFWNETFWNLKKLMPGQRGLVGSACGVVGREILRLLNFCSKLERFFQIGTNFFFKTHQDIHGIVILYNPGVVIHDRRIGSRA